MRGLVDRTTSSTRTGSLPRDGNNNNDDDNEDDDINNNKDDDDDDDVRSSSCQAPKNTTLLSHLVTVATSRYELTDLS